MYLRKLDLKDAPIMLSWMHDQGVVSELHTDFTKKTIMDCIGFIKSSALDMNDIHYAIASEQDEYMGTVSLKRVERDKRIAEFAIVVRREAMGQGYAWYGMKTILRKAFDEFGFCRVYWCVSKRNERAVRFYEKHGFIEDSSIPTDILEHYADEKDLKWYSICKKRYEDGKQ